ncbi:MAG: helix-turn-helix transcriptional regulator, partial [Pseudomonadota bacterium]
DFWTGVAEEDLLAAQILADPERVAVYDRAGEAHTDGMRALADAYGIRRMATALRLREGRSASRFLSAYRGGAARAWSRSEREFLRCAVDQISPAAQAARRWGEAPDDDAATLLVGRDGVAILGLDRARRRFGDLWSKSAGDRLPRPLSDYVDAPGEHLLIDSGLVSICENAGSADGLALRKLTLRPMRKFDLLTPRERQVARRLAEGESHKETARALGVSPSTIRNQTRSIYDKLGVENRASLAQAVPPAA